MILVLSQDECDLLSKWKDWYVIAGQTYNSAEWTPADAELWSYIQQESLGMLSDDGRMIGPQACREKMKMLRPMRYEDSVSIGQIPDYDSIEVKSPPLEWDKKISDCERRDNDELLCTWHVSSLRCKAARHSRRVDYLFPTVENIKASQRRADECGATATHIFFLETGWVKHVDATPMCKKCSVSASTRLTKLNLKYYGQTVFWVVELNAEMEDNFLNGRQTATAEIRSGTTVSDGGQQGNDGGTEAKVADGASGDAKKTGR